MTTAMTQVQKTKTRNPSSYVVVEKRSTTAGMDGERTRMTTAAADDDDQNNDRRQQQQQQTKSVVTPSNGTTSSTSLATDRSLYERIHVSKEIIDELLLVCGVIGTTDPVTGDIIPVTDCIHWLQDLQRVLRRDDDLLRPIVLLIGQWKIVQTKLIPLMMSCKYDASIVLTICKILVILTKPLNTNTIRAGQMIIDLHSNKKYPDAVIKEQIKLRENALQQIDALMEYKRFFCFNNHHHRRNGGSSSSDNSKTTKTPIETKNKNETTGVLSVFVSLLAEPLSRTGASRTDSDHLTIELVLHLFRNLLLIEPILHTSSDSKQRSVSLHNELIVLYEQELVLEIVLVLSANIESNENLQYNLLVMELLHHILRNQDPSIVAKTATLQNEDSNKTNDNENRKKTGTDPQPLPQEKTRTSTTVPSSSTTTATTRLTENLLREKQRKSIASTNRHSHFGGTIRLERPDTGKAHYCSAALLLQQDRNERNQSSTNALLHGPGGCGTSGTTSRRRNKKLEPFLGTSTGQMYHTNPNHPSSSGTTNPMNCTAAGGSSIVLNRRNRVLQTVHTFCNRFIVDCYGPVMKSLKNEFRRDSLRLEENDTTILFRIIWFFTQYYRLSTIAQQQNQQQQEQQKKDWNHNHPSRKTTNAATETETMDNVDENEDTQRPTNDSNNSSAIGQLIFTMDVFTFNLVLTNIETFYTMKKYAKLAQSVSLLTEMIYLLYYMYTSTDYTEQIMSIGLMDRLYYNDEPLDIVPKLLSRWIPGTTTREYLCTVMELCYITLKLLDTNAKALLADDDDEKKGTLAHSKGRRVTKKSRKGNEERQQQQHDTIERMKQVASTFNVTSYLSRKIVSNHTIYSLIQLLSMYKINAKHINHRIVSLLLRISNHVVSVPEENEWNAAVQHYQQKNQNTTTATTTTRIPTTIHIATTNHNDGAMEEDEAVVAAGGTATTSMLNPLVNRMVTLEPLLYNVPMFLVLNTILNDASIRNDSDYSFLLSFASKIVYNFSNHTTGTTPMTSHHTTIHPATTTTTTTIRNDPTTTTNNPMMFVEALFVHPLPYRYCEMVTNLYVSDELRMLVDREIARDEMKRIQQERKKDDEKEPTNDPHDLAKATGKDKDDDDDDTDELEFVERNYRKTPNDGVVRKTNVDSDDDSVQSRSSSASSTTNSIADGDKSDSDDDNNNNTDEENSFSTSTRTKSSVVVDTIKKNHPNVGSVPTVGKSKTMALLSSTSSSSSEEEEEDELVPNDPMENDEYQNPTRHEELDDSGVEQEQHHQKEVTSIRNKPSVPGGTKRRIAEHDDDNSQGY